MNGDNDIGLNIGMNSFNHKRRVPTNVLHARKFITAYRHVREIKGDRSPIASP